MLGESCASRGPRAQNFLHTPCAPGCPEFSWGQQRQYARGAHTRQGAPSTECPLSNSASPVNRVPSLQLRYGCLTACRDWHRFAAEDYKHTRRAFFVWHVVVPLGGFSFVYLVIVPLDDISKSFRLC